jgi:hypothetical protein
MVSQNLARKEKMKLKPKKEELLKELNDVNYEYFKKVMEEEPQEDSIGMNSDHLFRALRYVPNTEIKKWIKEMKKDIKI